MRPFALIAFALLFVACDNRTQNVIGPSPFDQPPVINSFTADATRLNSPFLDTFLRWDVTGSADTRCRIDAVGQPSMNIGNVPLGGFVQVRPVVSRDYALSCTNRGGTVVRTVSILVG
jgi:hypothetical protein